MVQYYTQSNQSGPKIPSTDGGNMTDQPLTIPNVTFEKSKDSLPYLKARARQWGIWQRSTWRTNLFTSFNTHASHFKFALGFRKMNTGFRTPSSLNRCPNHCRCPRLKKLNKKLVIYASLPYAWNIACGHPGGICIGAAWKKYNTWAPNHQTNGQTLKTVSWGYFWTTLVTLGVILYHLLVYGGGWSKVTLWV